jgi:hypothetical protein
MITSQVPKPAIGTSEHARPTKASTTPDVPKLFFGCRDRFVLWCAVLGTYRVVACDRLRGSSVGMQADSHPNSASLITIALPLMDME